MEERIREIIAQTGTKTSKIRQLIILGVSRTDVARLLTNGNYGQVQNVYTRMRAEGLIATITQTIATPTNPSMQPRIFDKQFGVELECYNVARNTLTAKLTAAGINCYEASRSARCTGYWKLTNDGSISGTNGFELVRNKIQAMQHLIYNNEVDDEIKKEHDLLFKEALFYCSFLESI